MGIGAVILLIVAPLVLGFMAQEAALRVSGVHDVANDIKVKVPDRLARTDTDLAQAVRTGLEWRSFIPSDRIQTSVSDGVVTLSEHLHAQLPL